jgi:hypothetical protein
VFTIASGAATLAIPVGSRLIARINSEAFERKYFPELKNVGNIAMQEFGMMTEYEHELDKLVTLAKKLESNPSFSGPYNRLYVYVHQNVLFSNQESVALREIRQDLNTTLETYTIAASGGTTKIASGVTGLIGGYNYYDKAIPANKLVAAGSTVYCSGTAAQLLEVIAAKARQEIKQSKLRQNNLLPSQLRKQRLEIIHIMENMLVN